MLPSRKITPRPATTVVEETELGQESSVGSSIDYARADHTHGTPSINNLGGGLAEVSFRDQADSKDRVFAEMTNSERTTVTVDPT